MVEIAGALSRHARIVVLDEPSAVLGGAELKKLFEIIRRLSPAKASASSTSRIGCRRCSRSATASPCCATASSPERKPVSEVDTQTLIRMMVGRRLAEIYPERTGRAGETVLSRRGLEPQGRARRHRPCRPAGRDPRHLRPCGLGTHRAAAGARGRRCVRRAEAIACAAGPSACTGPRAAIREGVSLLPEDRKSEGCFLPQSVAFNITISGLKPDAQERRS